MAGKRSKQEEKRNLYVGSDWVDSQGRILCFRPGCQRNNRCLNEKRHRCSWEIGADRCRLQGDMTNSTEPDENTRWFCGWHFWVFAGRYKPTPENEREMFLEYVRRSWLDPSGRPIQWTDEKLEEQWSRATGKELQPVPF